MQLGEAIIGGTEGVRQVRFIGMISTMDQAMAEGQMERSILPEETGQASEGLRWCRWRFADSLEYSR
jgi:hypothetical protein